MSRMTYVTVTERQNLPAEQKAAMAQVLRRITLSKNLNMERMRKEIYRRYYGLSGRRIGTMEEIGNVYDVTKSRVQQIVIEIDNIIGPVLENMN